MSASPPKAVARLRPNKGTNQTIGVRSPDDRKGPGGAGKIGESDDLGGKG